MLIFRSWPIQRTLKDASSLQMVNQYLLGHVHATQVDCNIAMKILDPHLHDGIHEWRDGKRFVKEGDKLYLEGTNTLAGRYFYIHLP